MNIDNILNNQVSILLKFLEPNNIFRTMILSNKLFINGKFNNEILLTLLSDKYLLLASYISKSVNCNLSLIINSIIDYELSSYHKNITNIINIIRQIGYNKTVKDLYNLIPLNLFKSSLLSLVVENKITSQNVIHIFCTHFLDQFKYCEITGHCVFGLSNKNGNFKICINGPNSDVLELQNILDKIFMITYNADGTDNVYNIIYQCTKIATISFYSPPYSRYNCTIKSFIEFSVSKHYDGVTLSALKSKASRKL